MVVEFVSERRELQYYMSDPVRFLQILHELGHLIFDSKGHPLLTDDGTKNEFGSSVSSQDNTDIILKNCRKQIEASGKY